MSGLAAPIDWAISLNFGPEVAQAASNIDPTMTATVPTRLFMLPSLWLDRKPLGRRHGRKGSFDREIESHQGPLLEDDIPLVDVLALERDDLVLRSVHLALHDRTDEFPSCIGAQRRRVAG